MRRARFWVMAHGSPVKLQLNAGQQLHWMSGGPHEEGWSAEYYMWSYDARGFLVCSYFEEGRDCDGYISHSSTCIASLFKLREHAYSFWCDPNVRFPEWDLIQSAQCDDVPRWSSATARLCASGGVLR
jgi:hypothetical protein